jgi:hypothetical protein
MKKIITTTLLAIGIITSYAQTTRYSFHKEGGQFGPLDKDDPAITSNDAIDDMMIKVKIGFPFKFNGAFYDSVGISENGFIWFGGAQPSDMDNYQTNPISTDLPQSVAGVVSAMGIDLHPHVNTSLTTTIRYGMSGTDHFCIEWRNTSRIDAMQAGVEDTLSFQINLYKVEFNRIDVIYNPTARFGLSETIATPDQIEVGIKGASLSDFTNRMTDATHAWNNTLAGTSVNSTCKLSVDTNPSMSLFNFLVWYDDQTTGVAKQENELSGINVYPVPTKDIIYVEVSEAEKDALVAYEIYDVQGKLMNKGNISTKSININDLEQGIYFLRVFSDQSVYTNKIIKD